MTRSAHEARVGLWVCVLIAIVCVAASAWAQGGGNSGSNTNGAIYTTVSDGTTVNGNIYAAKPDVYISGGPQNKQDPGLVPDGNYYFQVTDPSGAVLLSLDDVKCRVVVVSNGRVNGVPADNAGGFGDPSCYHMPGTQNDANGALPVQLCSKAPLLCDAPNSYKDTPNNGGEYKAWMIPVQDYDSGNAGQCHGAAAPGECWGFVDASSKTDNFKVKKANAAYVTVCKFNDENANGSQDSGEPFIAAWPITATGVDTLSGPIGTVNAQTDENGCVSFSVSDFSQGGIITLTEGFQAGNWQQTAPPDGTYTVDDGQGGTITVTVVNGVESFALVAGDAVSAPNFGNACLDDSCGGNEVQLVVTKDANPSLTRTYKWDITKSVDTTTAYTNGNDAVFNYTVEVTHDSGTDSAWQVSGTIRVSNPSLIDIAGVNVSDAVDNGGNCSLTGNGTNVTVPAQGHVDVPYLCTYTALPGNGTNTATATWDSSFATGTAGIDFSLAAVQAVDDSVTVTDTFGGTLGTVTSADASPKTYMYSHTFSGDPAGTCTSHENTATFTTDTTSTTGSASQTVKDCQGADLIVSKTAATAYDSSISKSVDKTLVEQSGGSYTFNYTVKVTTSNWKVSGTITVQNPNDWEAITANLGDALTDLGGSCSITGGSTVTIAASSSVSPTYTCTFAAVPGANSGTNTATASWDSAAYYTPHASASGTAGYSFSSLTITDCWSAKGTTCTPTTLGTVTVPPGTATFNYTHMVSVSPGTCQEYDNTATIKETGATSSATATLCNTQTGALTLGFWQNKNGQGIITGGASTGGVCKSGTWLRMFNPFSDLSSTATCAQVASYVTSVIKAANCSTGGTCNAMLKAQMLATALDVYFSDPTLGGNKIGSYSGLGIKQPAVGGVAIDLSHVCAMVDGSSATCTGTYEDSRPEFGIAAPCLGTTVLQMLAYSNYGSAVNGSPVSNIGGSYWYMQIKTRQVYAKDGFDNINNQIANISPTSCSSTF